MKKVLINIGIITLVFISGVLILNRSDSDTTQASLVPNEQQTIEQKNSIEYPIIVREEVDSTLATATFAGGCFWCTEAVFQELVGVENAISGYAGGIEYNPTYEAVYKETTSHREAVRVYYNPEIVSYEEILDVYWQSIDPTDSGGQFVDRGESYTTAVFYESEEQKVQAEASKIALQNSGKFNKQIVTNIVPFTTFYEAEAYHQDFYLNSKERYKNYASNSGRDEFKAQVWKQIQAQ